MGSENINFVIAAYTLTWVFLGSYAIHTHAGLRRARREYERATQQSARGAS